jgi:hypothetical protein
MPPIPTNAEPTKHVQKRAGPTTAFSARLVIYFPPLLRRQGIRSLAATR